MVYNPQDDNLPPPQQELEKDYKAILWTNYKIVFDNLFTLANMPIKRFGSTLISKNKFDKYRKDLINHEISFLEICKREELILTAKNIAPLSHWITPDFEIKRFDTRFFIAY